MKSILSQSIVPSELCLKCDVCCRFPEPDAPLAPFFTEEEVQAALGAGLAENSFKGKRSGRIRLIPFPDEIESPGHNGGCICPSFNPRTQECSIYEVRPFDCQLYPFVLMRQGENLLFGMDTKCPFIRDPENHPVLESYGKKLSLLLKSTPYQEMFRKYPDLIGTFQEDVTILYTL